MSNNGCLYVVATPIGNLQDLSARARQVLQEVDVIAAEDTRHSGRLLAHFGIDTPQLSLHEHNETARTAQLMRRLEAGDNVALISDAGTPLVSDPGYTLIHEVRQRGLTVSPVPGPSAVIAALSVAGLPTDRFVFEGFLPAKSAARLTVLGALSQEARTMVFYVSVHQLTRQLEDMVEVFGGTRAATIARELTKLHETISFGTLADLLQQWCDNPGAHKGEIVVVVAGQPQTTDSTDELAGLLPVLLDYMGPKQAAAVAVRLIGCARNQAYKSALALQKSLAKPDD